MKRRFFGLPFLLVVALGSAVTFPAKGQETNAVTATNVWTLAALTAEAARNNPELHSLEADVAAADGELVTAKTWENPQVTVTPGVYREPASGSFGHVGFQLNQTILFPGKRALLRAVAEKSVEGRALALVAFRTQLAIQVRRAFYELLAAREVVALQQQRLTLAQSFTDAAKKKVEGGFAPDFEQTKSEVELAAAQKALREAQAREAVARTTLNSLAGRKPDSPLDLTGALGETVSVPDKAALLSQALEHNPSLKIQQAEVERTGLSLALTKKSRLPDFTVGPTVEYQEPEQVYGIGISLPLPLWNSKKGEVATATAEQKKALAELEQLQREILRDATTAWQNLAAAKESLAFYTSALRDKLKTSLDAAAQSYSQGQMPLLLYLETQRTYFDTQADYFDTLQKIFEARAELESAVGVSLEQLSQPQTESK